MVPTENLKNDFLSLFKKAVIRGMMVLMAANTTSALANGTHEAAHPDGTKISAAPHHTKWNHKNQHEWFGECNSEGPQSPTSLRDTDHTKGTTIQIKSAAAPLRIQNTGHAIRILFPEGSTARIDGTENIIKELHFHTPGEHPINGRIYPGEAHVVTQNPATGELTVIGLMMKSGQENPTLAKIGQYMPATAGEIETYNDIMVDPAEGFLSPKNLKKMISYKGTLTTPPCSRGVNWKVSLHTVEASPRQIAQLQDLFQDGNARHAHPRHSDMQLPSDHSDMPQPH